MYSLPFSGTAPALLAHCNKHSPAQTKLRRPWCRRAVPGRKREVSLDVDGQRQVQQRRVILLRVRPEIRLATVPGRNLVLRQAQDEVFLKPHAEPVVLHEDMVDTFGEHADCSGPQDIARRKCAVVATTRLIDRKSTRLNSSH